NVWELGPWQRVIETATDKTVANEIASRLTRGGRFTHMVTEAGSDADKKLQATAYTMQEAVIDVQTAPTVAQTIDEAYKQYADLYYGNASLAEQQAQFEVYQQLVEAYKYEQESQPAQDAM